MQAIQPRLLIILVWKLDGNEILGQTFSYIVVYHMWLSSFFRNACLLCWKFPGTQTWIFSHMESSVQPFDGEYSYCEIGLSVSFWSDSCLATDLTSHFLVAQQQLFEWIKKLGNIMRQHMLFVNFFIFYFSGWRYGIGGT